MRISHRALLGVVALLVGASLAAMAVMWPSPQAAPEGADELVDPAVVVDATLVEVVTVDDDPLDAMLFADATLVEVTAELDDTGERVTFETTDETGDTYAEGQRVELSRVEVEGGEESWFVSDFQRSGALVLLASLFAVAVVAFGRWQGLRALAGLGLTFVLIIGFIVPAILDGTSPVAVALAGGVAIMIATLYLAHGFGPKTSAAVVGTAGALLVTVLLAGLFTQAATLTGFTSEEARLANVEVAGLSLRGLLLAGIIIGALGVLDDVTMSQSSTVFALRRADPEAGFTRLLAEGLSVGRDHVAATVNTLVLAYAGAALPLLILFSTGAAPAAEILTAEIVAVEIVRTLVGSLGLIAAVPLTTALAAAVALDQGPGDRRAGGGRAPAHAHAEYSRGADEAAGSAGASHAPAEQLRPPATVSDDDWVERLRDAYNLPREPGPERQDDP